MAVFATVAFHGVPDGMVYPRAFAEGDEVTGELAAVAIREGWAEEREGDVPAPPPQPARRARRSGGTSSED